MAQAPKITNTKGRRALDASTQSTLQTSKKVLEKAYRVLSETQHQVQARERKPTDPR